MIPKRPQHDPKAFPIWSHNDHKMITKWSHNDHKMSPKWSQDDPKMIPKLSKNDRKMIPNWSHIHTFDTVSTWIRQSRHRFDTDSVHGVKQRSHEITLKPQFAPNSYFTSGQHFFCKDEREKFIKHRIRFCFEKGSDFSPAVRQNVKTKWAYRCH